MANTELDHELRSRIDAFVQDISAIVRRSALEAVRKALDVGAQNGGRSESTLVRTGRIGDVRTARGGKRRRRGAADLQRLQTKFVAFVKKNPGKGIEDIAKAIGESSKELRFPVMKLLAAKKVKTVGQKRGTRYHAT